MSKLRIGMIGAGGMARSHALALKKVRRAQIAKVMDVNLKAAEKLASELNVAATRNLDDIIRDDSIDTVFMVTPPSCNREIFTKAAKAGKNIFIEKPIAHTASDARAIVNVQKKTKVFASAGFVLRYHPLWKKMKELVVSGAIGSIKSIWDTRTILFRPLGWRKDAALGGLFLDFNAHDVDFIRWLVGSELADAGGYWQKFHRGDADDNLVLSMRFKNGVIANINSSRHSKGPHYCITIIGTKGTLSVHGDGYNPASIDHYDNNSAVSKKKIRLKQNVDIVFEQDNDFVRRVLSGRKPAMPMSEAFKSLKMTHDLYKSLEFVE